MSKARELAELGAVYDSGALSNRNMIINGAMQVAQRGTSQTATGYGSVDRMSLGLSGGTATMSQQTNSSTDRATTGFDKYLRLAFSAGNNNGGLSYGIEAADILQAIGKKITLSFFAKGTNPNGGSFDVLHYWYDGSNADNGTSGTLTVTSTWTKYSITLDTATVSSASLTAAASAYYLGIQQPNGDTSTNAWTLDITGLQLELGTEATPFEHRSFADELARCQRYYHYQGKAANTALIGGYHASADDDYCGYTVFPTQMRATPTFTRNGTFTVFNCGQPNAIFLSKESCTLYANVSGPANWYAHANGTDDFFEWDAEL